MKQKYKNKYLEISKNKNKSIENDILKKDFISIKCPNCKFDNQKDSEKKFNTCFKCGHPLDFEIKLNIKIYKMFLLLLIFYFVITFLFIIANILYNLV
jgi:hypothetical protein